MQANKEGFAFPTLTSVDKCLGCNKCNDVCPILSGTKRIKVTSSYLLVADDETRSRASSGGAFPVMAQAVLGNGGYVCGAAWSADFRTVEHRIISKLSELPDLCYSKYLQSDLHKCFIDIKVLLEENIAVLFCGCPCQVAGLNNYLGKDYEKLITVELICHGVPSPMVWQRWIDSTLHKNSASIASVCMRNKRIGWRGKLLLLLLSDGTEYRETRNDGYNRAFLKNYNLRRCCYNCSFKSSDLLRPADITIGDFWNIAEFDKKFDDNKGVSIVLSSNGKGDAFLKTLKIHMMKPVPIKFAQQKNLLASEKHPHEQRKIFFNTIRRYDFNTSLSLTEGTKDEVCVIGNYANENIGGQLTTLAVYKIIECLGYPVKMLRNYDHIRDEKRSLLWESLCKFTISSDNNLANINRDFVSFVTCPDWTFARNWSRGWNVHLQHWTSDEKNRISFASSFGNYDKNGGYAEEDFPELKRRLERFNTLTVREPQGVELCKSIGIDKAMLMHDAVFGLGRGFYEALSEIDSMVRSEIRSIVGGKFLLTYLRDYDESKIKQILDLASELALIPLLLMGYEKEKEYLHRFEINEKGIIVFTDITMCEWLYCLNHSEFVLTDSFHCTCFSLIFNKPFITMTRRNKGLLPKLVSITTNAGLPERLIDITKTSENSIIEIAAMPINWSAVNVELSKWKAECNNFIDTALSVTAHY
jgi:coenzyme F420-reducing hydrogenase beta subunit